MSPEYHYSTRNTGIPHRRFYMVGRKFFNCLLLIVALQGALASNAFAYLDPGTGSFYFQVVIATIIGGLFSVKNYWQKIKDFFINHFARKLK